MKLAKLYERNRKNKPFEVKFYDEDGKRCSKSFGDKLVAIAFLNECNADNVELEGGTLL